MTNPDSTLDDKVGALCDLTTCISTEAQHSHLTVVLGQFLMSDPQVMLKLYQSTLHYAEIEMLYIDSIIRLMSPEGQLSPDKWTSPNIEGLLSFAEALLRTKCSSDQEAKDLISNLEPLLVFAGTKAILDPNFSLTLAPSAPPLTLVDYDSASPVASLEGSPSAPPMPKTRRFPVEEIVEVKELEELRGYSPDARLKWGSRKLASIALLTPTEMTLRELSQLLKTIDGCMQGNLDSDRMVRSMQLQAIHIYNAAKGANPFEDIDFSRAFAFSTLLQRVEMPATTSLDELLDILLIYRDLDEDDEARLRRSFTAYTELLHGGTDVQLCYLTKEEVEHVHLRTSSANDSDRNSSTPPPPVYMPKLALPATPPPSSEFIAAYDAYQRDVSHNSPPRAERRHLGRTTHTGAFVPHLGKLPSSHSASHSDRSSFDLIYGRYNRQRRSSDAALPPTPTPRSTPLPPGVSSAHAGQGIASPRPSSTQAARRSVSLSHHRDSRPRGPQNGVVKPQPRTIEKSKIDDSIEAKYSEYSLQELWNEFTRGAGDNFEIPNDKRTATTTFNMGVYHSSGLTEEDQAVVRQLFADKFDADTDATVAAYLEEVTVQDGKDEALLRELLES